MDLLLKYYIKYQGIGCPPGIKIGLAYHHQNGISNEFYVALPQDCLYTNCGCIICNLMLLNTEQLFIMHHLH